MDGFSYYYNWTPEWGYTRNNLIYTSFISDDKKTFVQWYYNDTDYHKGKNEVVDPELMEMKWHREVKFLTMMRDHYPDLVPNILDIDYNKRMIFLEVDGPDFWQNQTDIGTGNFDDVLPDWQEQMLRIIRAHKELGIYKFSMHPSSYFIVNGKMKSINYFFCYTKDDGARTVREHLSHISENRRITLFKQMEAMGIKLDIPISLQQMQILAFESFRTNFPSDFIEKAKEVYVSDDSLVA
jgi:hypothetical protein